MSGHSKWHNIQAKKGKTDAQRGKIFTKLGRELAVAVKEGGPDPSSNTRLRYAIDKAKQSNMPSDVINRAIKKASGELNSVNFESITYEGYGIAGSAVIVECLTDNKNRTAGDVRHCFDKFGGSLGSNGCVSYLFKSKGIIIIEKKDGLDFDSVFMQAVDAGADDIVEEDDAFTIITKNDNLLKVKSNLENSGLIVVSSDIELVPDLYIELDEDKFETFQKMIEKLEDLDDVQQVYHNVK